MSVRVSVTVVVALLSTARLTSGQGITPADLAPAASTIDGAPTPGAPPPFPDQGIVLPPAPAPGGVNFGAPTPHSPFTSIGHDLKAFFTHRETAVVMGVFAPAAGVAFTWDQAGIEESQEHLQGSVLQGRRHRRRLRRAGRRRARHLGGRDAVAPREDEGDRWGFAAGAACLPGDRAGRQAGDAARAAGWQ